MSANKKIEEANEYIRQAEKCLKTSFLKWKPDYELAAEEYQKAAVSFRTAKAFDQSKNSYLKAADCHKQTNSWFHAAKCYDQAILICNESKNLSEIKGFAEKASSLYQQHGSADAGATVLEKAAKILEQNYPQDAITLYQRAADVSLIEDSSRQGAEYVNKVARIMVKLQMYDQAADALRRVIGLYQSSDSYQSIGRLTVALVLVQLAREDFVAAEKAFKEWGNCCDAAEVQTLERLLQAYDDEDPDAAARALRDPFIRHMDVEFARLATILPLPKGVSIEQTPASNTTCAPSASVMESAATSYVAAKEKDIESKSHEEESEDKRQPSDDDDDDGLR